MNKKQETIAINEAKIAGKELYEHYIQYVKSHPQNFAKQLAKDNCEIFSKNENVKNACIEGILTQKKR